MSFVSFSHLDFSYESTDGALFHDLTFQIPPGWTGIVGANGSGKSTLLKLVCGMLRPERGFLQSGGLRLLCEQEVAAPPENADGFFASRDGCAFRLRGAFRITPDMPGRWNTLSMGERKKIQIAAALFRRPDVLCIDEPTNHLDSTARSQLFQELRNYRGIGLLVSHDRELLDELCGRCLFLSPGRAVLRSGGISEGLEAEALEREQAAEQYRQLKTELRRNKRELQRRREKEQEARNKNSKRKLDRHDHDAKGRIDAARVSGRDRAQQDLAGAQAKTVERTAARLDAIDLRPVRKLGLNIPYGCYSTRNLLFDLPPFELDLHGRVLTVPRLAMGSRDRIALTGENGSGKSTLLRRILPELKLSADEFLYMPQELDESVTSEIRRSLPVLSRNNYSKVMNVVASLGSRPERVLDAETCSPGEWRKLFFGLGVLREIKLIVMDEPTNHLDFPSIECLEAALADCNCALLLISHDRKFLDNLCARRWHIELRTETEHILREQH